MQAKKWICINVRVQCLYIILDWFLTECTRQGEEFPWGPLPRYRLLWLIFASWTCKVQEVIKTRHLYLTEILLHFIYEIWTRRDITEWIINATHVFAAMLLQSIRFIESERALQQVSLVDPSKSIPAGSMYLLDPSALILAISSSWGLSWNSCGLMMGFHWFSPEWTLLIIGEAKRVGK